jgi:hypothetical protein
MYGDLGRAARTGAWVAVALIALSACNAAPGGSSPAASGGASSAPVVEYVRLATDRSAARQEVVTLPNGERMRRVSLPNGFSHVLVGRVDANGKRSLSCVDSAPAAESFLASPGQRGSE